MWRVSSSCSSRCDTLRVNGVTGVDICKIFTQGRSRKPACQFRADRESASDGLVCLFVLSLSLSIHFNSPRISILVFFALPRSQFLCQSVSRQVAELKSELKLRGLPVSGTKNDLIERLRAYQELSAGGDTTSAPTAGGTAGPGAEGAGRSSEAAAATANNNNDNTSQQQQPLQCNEASSLTGQSSSTRSSSRRRVVYSSVKMRRKTWKTAWVIYPDCRVPPCVSRMQVAARPRVSSSRPVGAPRPPRPPHSHTLPARRAP